MTRPALFAEVMAQFAASPGTFAAVRSQFEKAAFGIQKPSVRTVTVLSDGATLTSVNIQKAAPVMSPLLRHATELAKARTPAKPGEMAKPGDPAMQHSDESPLLTAARRLGKGGGESPLLTAARRLAQGKR